MTSNFFITLFSFITAISVLVFIHEFGHFIVGRYFGIKVLKFSIGFGKKLWSKTHGDDQTEYCISLIPLGGYVKFLDGREGEVEKEDVGRAFNHRPIYARIAVLLAGPLFNFIFAILAYWFLLTNGVLSVKPVIGDVLGGSYAEDAGLLYGDEIQKVGNKETLDWESVIIYILNDITSTGSVHLEVKNPTMGSRKSVIEIQEDSSSFTEPGEFFQSLGFYPWRPPAVVGSVYEGSPAERLGIRTGDQITSIDGEHVKTFDDLVNAVSSRPGKIVSIVFNSNGNDIISELELGTTNNNGLQRGFLGISLSEQANKYIYIKTYDFKRALLKSLSQTWVSTVFTVKMFGRILTGKVSLRNISGPVTIAKYAGESASIGFNEFLRFLALVSISLGVINLFPIPMLDGGQILYQGIELIKGEPLSMRFQVIGNQIGIMALIILMSVAFYNDIFNLY